MALCAGASQRATAAFLLHKSLRNGGPYERIIRGCSGETKRISNRYRGGTLNNLASGAKTQPAGKTLRHHNDTIVNPLYAEPLCRSLREAGIPAQVYAFAHGEASKTRQTKEWLENSLLDDGFGRDSAILAVGGGVVGDVAGFVAATYMRGVPFAQVPTTTLAQVDSSIGGKTAVDVPQGKNLIGAFHHPAVVYMDPQTLMSLDERNYFGGLVELVKHGFIADEEFLAFYRQHQQTIVARSGTEYADMMEELMLRNCRIKNEVVRLDEQETNLRKILNYGHTLGHGVEILSDFLLSHGESVAGGNRVCRVSSLATWILHKGDHGNPDGCVGRIGYAVPHPGLHHCGAADTGHEYG